MVLHSPIFHKSLFGRIIQTELSYCSKTSPAEYPDKLLITANVNSDSRSIKAPVETQAKPPGLLRPIPSVQMSKLALTHLH